jgi:hypothetical protein
MDESFPPLVVTPDSRWRRISMLANDHVLVCQGPPPKGGEQAGEREMLSALKTNCYKK